MKQAKNLIIIGGILLMAGAITPWATISGIFNLSRSIYGYQGDGIISGIAGLIILILGLSLKPDTKTSSYSPASTILSMLTGVFLLYKIYAVLNQISQQDESVSISIGYGLLCLSPIGVILAFMGGVTNTPKIPPQTETPPSS